MSYNWWQVHLSLLPAETVAAPADLVDAVKDALDKAEYVRRGSVGLRGGAIVVLVDVVADRASAAIRHAERTVDAAAKLRVFQAATRKVR